ncbi:MULTISPECIES: hypothetical protein [Leptospira]|uniref:hypothetical protein n=1 Tax=Leptospira TaxID=171 RepID=UPI0002BA579E|nr:MULTISPECIES: hypothetical protein [Leptospira]MBE0303856.1 hypothetical protein [Leptospira interrogans serovar Yeoncheon]MCL8311282.1 hypothetical protein [Leptospira interrogans]QCO35238.1 hypothetical protein E4414_16240 [Leptospira interrogans]ULG83224.1 hypothetical protein FH594_12840 [Leptospira interrogans]ULG89910.1 hypothetical protein FH593_07880 [Leptospira interrogans]
MNGNVVFWGGCWKVKMENFINMYYKNVMQRNILSDFSLEREKRNLYVHLDSLENQRHSKLNLTLCGLFGNVGFWLSHFLNSEHRSLRVAVLGRSISSEWR